MSDQFYEGLTLNGVLEVGSSDPAPQPIGQSESLPFDFDFTLANGDEFAMYGALDQTNGGAGGGLSTGSSFVIEYIGDGHGGASQTDTLIADIYRTVAWNASPVAVSFSLSGLFGGGIATGSSASAVYIANGTTEPELGPFFSPASYSTGETETVDASGGELALQAIRTYVFAADSPVGSYVTNGGAVPPICFLPGTLINTPIGDVAVQRLTVGDHVRTFSGQPRRIVWIGQGKVVAARGRRTPATPVIIRKGALADNVPHHDLRMTKAHSLYIDDVLIPVEFLINHRSIIWDDHAQEVSLYHIELETHDVLLANGAPAESYRDDGNRWLFQNANARWGLAPQPPCAPVLTSGHSLDAIWRRLRDRAGPGKPPPLTDDPDLHLLIDGKRLDAIEQRGDRYVFRLPARPWTARLCSRAAAPQELGTSRDPRTLGVALRRIVLAGPKRQWTLTADAAALTNGYHAFEPENDIRWTDGDAELPRELFAATAGPCLLILQLGGMTHYRDDDRFSNAA